MHIVCFSCENSKLSMPLMMLLFLFFVKTPNTQVIWTPFYFSKFLKCWERERNDNGPWQSSTHLSFLSFSLFPFLFLSPKLAFYHPSSQPYTIPTFLKAKTPSSLPLSASFEGCLLSISFQVWHIFVSL